MDTAVLRAALRARLSHLRLLLLALVVGAAGLVTGAAPAHAGPASVYCFVYQDSLSPVVPWVPLPAYNSCGATGVAYGAPNHYLIDLPGVYSPNAVAHVTAVTDPSDSAWCELVALSPSGADAIVHVACFRPGGSPAAARFSLTYESGIDPAAQGGYGYVWDDFGTIRAALSSAGPAPTITAKGVGRYLVTFNNLGAQNPGTGSLQVTAVNQSPARCKPAFWLTMSTLIQFEVDCVDGSSNPAPSGFTATYQNQFDLTGRPVPANSKFGYVMNGGGPLANFNGTVGFGANNVSSVTPPPFYPIQFPRVGLDPSNGQITAFGSNADYCHLAADPLPWSSGGASAVMPHVECWSPAVNQTTDPFFAAYTSVGP